MGLFDNLKNKADQAIKNVVKDTSSKTEAIVFTILPNNLDEFKAMPQAAMSTPFETAAMTVLAFCCYPDDPNTSLAMLDFLRGPKPLSPYEKSFIKDRFSDKDYVPRSYFDGATPANDYVPSEPYTVKVSSNPYSYANEGYAKLFVTSGGADSPREIVLREAKDGKWYLWDQMILGGIREPESANPWA